MRSPATKVPMERSAIREQTAGVIQSYRSWLWSSPSRGELAALVTTLIVVGSLLPFAELVAAPLLIYAGKQIAAQPDTDVVKRLIGSAAFATGWLMLALAAWSLLQLGELFLPQTIS
jgi:hypothetical protein